MVAHAFSPSTQEAEMGESLSVKPAWSTERVPGQSGLHREKQNRWTWNMQYCEATVSVNKPYICPHVRSTVVMYIKCMYG